MTNEEGYILFNAEGKKPKAMFAAYMEDDGIRIAVDGNRAEILMLFACFAADFINQGIGDSEELMKLILFAKMNGDNTAAAFKTLIEEAMSDEEA